MTERVGVQRNFDTIDNLKIRKEFGKRYLSPNDQLREHLVSFLNLKGDETIVEVGCGYGDFLDCIQRKGHKGKLIGYDISHSMIREARKRTKNILFEIADAQEIPLKDCSCDIVLLRHVLYFIHDIKKAMEEAYRILKPGGLVGITLNSRANKSRAKVEEYKAFISKKINRPCKKTIERINMENYNKYTKQFQMIKEFRKCGYAHLKNPEPFVEYMGSYREFYKPIPTEKQWEDVLQAVRNRIIKEIRKNGYFQETMCSGITILQK